MYAYFILDRSMDHLIHSTDSISQCGSSRLGEIRHRHTYGFVQPPPSGSVHHIPTQTDMVNDESVHTSRKMAMFPDVPQMSQSTRTSHYTIDSGKIIATGCADACSEPNEDQVSRATSSGSFVSLPSNRSLHVTMNPDQDVKERDEETRSPIVSYEEDRSCDQIVEQTVDASAIAPSRG